MSSASKSKFKGKAGKEHSIISMKPSTIHSSHGSPASAHNPPLGIFRAFDIPLFTFSTPFRSNDSFSTQFRSTNDPDDHSASFQGTTEEYDSLFNNSCSSVSDYQKERPAIPPPQPERILGCDNVKRNMNRWKKERKHKRQKEKRAQELHDRCSTFLMSRKLEVLSRQLQLVAMGFPLDRATMAVIANEGPIEESVAWLLHEEGNDEQQVSFDLEDQTSDAFDIADELAWITKMEVEYLCLRQDVERAVVACEGDLLKAKEKLKARKQAAAALRSDETPNRSPESMKNSMKEATQTAITQHSHEGPDSNFAKSAPKPIDSSRTQACPIKKGWSTMNPPIPRAPPVRAWASPAKPDTRFGETMSREGKSSFPVEAREEPVVFMRQSKEKLPLMEIPTAVNTDLGINIMGGWNWNTSSPSATMSFPGLFAGRGLPASSLSAFTNGWDSPRSTPRRDYTSIDWSLDLTTISPSMKIDVASDTWSTMFIGGNATWWPPMLMPLPFMNGGGGGGICFPGSQEVGGLLGEPLGSGSSQEWGSPFEGKDRIRFSKTFVPPHSML